MRTTTSISFPLLVVLAGAGSLAIGCMGPSDNKSKAAKDGKTADQNKDGKDGGKLKAAVDDAKAKAKAGKSGKVKPEAKTAKMKRDGKAIAKADAKAPAGGKTFRKGQLAPAKMTPDEVKAYATAQGDPRGGVFSLEDALAGDEALADKSKGKLHATFKTNLGEFTCELYEDKTPGTVANFVGLARGVRESYDKKADAWVKKPFYDGIIFHRVIKGFMIQTGDPTGTGSGGPGYVIVDEFDKSLRHDGGGYLSMANRGPNTGSSQFFVTVNKTPHLNDKHAIFGKCDDKVPVQISEVKVDARRNHRPYDPVKIEGVTFARK